MDEAAEIAKLRLFLKLAAQINDVNHVEPLPDLDFNIKTGNLLVGIADEGDADHRLGEGHLDFGGEIDNVRRVSEQVAEAYDTFVSKQAEDLGTLNHSIAKQKLSTQLEAARSLANTLLHSLRNESAKITEWCDSHKPFHWFVEFPSVWRNGGFDVIIGNPPYIKTKNVRSYTWQGYQTQRCPDIYAVCVERASILINKQGRFGMIVMHSLCFGWKFEGLRSWLSSCFGSMWISSYWAGRMGLFTGANPRNAIIIASKPLNDTSIAKRWSTRCNRWLTKRREILFDQLEYCLVAHSLEHATLLPQWPFVDPAISDALCKMVAANTTVKDSLVRQSPYALGYKTTALYQLGIYETEPPTVDPRTGADARTKSTRTGWLYFGSSLERDLTLIALAGRWGFLWWLTYSNEFSVTRGTLSAFPSDIKRLAKVLRGMPRFMPATADIELVQNLVTLSTTLRTEMPQHLAWMVKAGVKVGRYNMRQLRHITDKADWLLAQAWGLTLEEHEAAGNLRDRMVFGNKD